jgi:hypothetical protein
VSALFDRALHATVIRHLRRAQRVAKEDEGALAKALEAAQRSREELARWTRLAEEAAPLIYEDDTTQMLRIVGRMNAEWDANDAKGKAA